MHKNLIHVGLSGEPIDWELENQRSDERDTVYDYTAKSKMFNRTYHACVSDGVCGISYRYTIR